MIHNLVLLVVLSSSLFSQTFEAASVKPRNRADPEGGAGCSGGPGTKDPVHYRCVSVPISSLAETAYGIPIQDMDVPQWTATTLNGYDIQAVVPEGATKDDFRVMLQNLLTERFHMKWHRETKELDVYVLTAPKPKFQPSSPGTRYSLVGSNLYNRDQPIMIVARGIAMQDFASLLVPILQRRVVNETNLQGAFDFDLEFVAPDAGVPTAGPSVFAAFSDLGFSLKTGKRAVNLFVIDSADRTPTPN